MSGSDRVFSGNIAQLYDRYLGTAMFGPYAEDIARRLAGLTAGALLEVAAGTGIVTTALARALPATVAITATDLNQPMLDLAATKPGLERVTWRQADAMSLPFADASFDVVVCQFGVMFFPDRPGAHAEARRVLRPGGRYLFNVWDSLAANPVADIIHQTVAALFPARPPGFIGRTPFGHHDRERLRADLRAGGFAECSIEEVAASWPVASARDAAIGYCEGTPLRAEIEAADPDGLARATDAATAAIAARYGEGAFASPIRAVLVEARK